MAHGILPSRIIFLTELPAMKYDTLLSVADIFLDTRVYNAHTIASDSMFFGLPVATLPGDSFASRVAGSLNAAAGLEELLNHQSRKEFVDRTLQMTVDHSRYEVMKTKVLAAKGGYLFNSANFTTRLEHAYQAVVQVKKLGRKPMHVFSDLNM